MTGRERILKAISHKEADRVPIDVGGCLASAFNIKAYAALLEHLGYSTEGIEISNKMSQLAKIDEKIYRKFSIDSRGIFPKLLFSGNFIEKNYGSEVVDEWGIKWFMPNKDGHFYDMISHPLKDSSIDEVRAYKWVDGANPDRFTDIESQIEEAVQGQNAVVIGATIGNGIFQTGNWLEGYEDFLCDLATDSDKAELIMDKVVEIKMAFWETILKKWGAKIDIVLEMDDLGMQTGLLISPKTYKTMLKPRQKVLFEFIKKKAPHIKLLFHSCGSIKPIIPDLIEIGIDILNPVQISACDMNPMELKKNLEGMLLFGEEELILRMYFKNVHLIRLNMR